MRSVSRVWYSVEQRYTVFLGLLMFRGCDVLAFLPLAEQRLCVCSLGLITSWLMSPGDYEHAGNHRIPPSLIISILCFEALSDSLARLSKSQEQYHISRRKLSRCTNPQIPFVGLSLQGQSLLRRFLSWLMDMEAGTPRPCRLLTGPKGYVIAERERVCWGDTILVMHARRIYLRRSCWEAIPSWWSRSQRTALSPEEHLDNIHDIFPSV